MLAKRLQEMPSHRIQIHRLNGIGEYPDKNGGSYLTGSGKDGNRKPRIVTIENLDLGSG